MSRREHEREIRLLLEPLDPDLICLAGYLRVLSPEFVSAYAGRILNIHPSLLPRFPGLDAQRQALEAGETVSGCTVHFVDAGLDSGPIVLQRSVPVLPLRRRRDALRADLEQEHHLVYPAIRKILAAKGLRHSERSENLLLFITGFSSLRSSE